MDLNVKTKLKIMNKLTSKKNPDFQNLMHSKCYYLTNLNDYS
jgi:hypothetical protein